MDDDDSSSFDAVLKGFMDRRQKRDPRSLRLAAVTSAVVEIGLGPVGNNSASTVQLPAASKVYANTITALEGTLHQGTSSLDEGGGGGGARLRESLATQVALLELLEAVVPHVTPPQIVGATLPLTSRVLRAIVATTSQLSASPEETRDELGGVNAVLRWTCRAATQVLLRLNATTSTDAKAVTQFTAGTLLYLLNDKRPKVRKAAQSGLVQVLSAAGHGSVTVRKATTAHVHATLTEALQHVEEATNASMLHLLAFLERSILYLDRKKLGKDTMELLAALFQENTSAAAQDFVAMVKSKDSTPKTLVILALLSTVLALLGGLEEDEVHGNHSNETLAAWTRSEFAPRVLASLLTAQPAVLFRHGTAEEQILQRGRTIYGQVVLAAARATNDDMACRLVPLSIQLILLLSKPTEEEDPDNTSVANTVLVELMQFFRTRLRSLIDERPVGLDKCLKECLESMLQVHQAAFRPTWSVSLKGLVILIELIANHVDVTNAVQSLLNLHDEVPAGSAAQHAVEDALSTLVQGLGLEVTWEWMRFFMPSEQSETAESGRGIRMDRAWILPVLKSAAMTAQSQPMKLAFFQEHVLGTARTCDRIAATASKSARQKNFHHARVVDLWALLPCFCLGPPADIPASLPSLTATLGKALEDKRYPQLVPIICHSLSTLTKSVRENGSTMDKEAMGQATVKLLPIMFKLVTQNSASEQPSRLKENDMDVDEGTSASKKVEVADANQQTQILAEAISALSRHAPQPFLQGLFKKLMHRLLEEVQSDTSDVERVCGLLSLSQALVASGVLDEASLSFLYRALKPFIRNDECGARAQKRAYKVLAELCERHHSFFADMDRLKELTSLLTSTIMTSQVAARYMRLKCMNLIVDGFPETNEEHLNEFFKALAEMLLCLKDANGKTREAAYQLVLSLASKSDMSKFLQAVAASLGAETAHMRSAGVMALSRVVYELAWENEELHALLPTLLSTVLVLINENSREVIKSVVGFVRISVAAIPAQQLEPLLPDLVGSLLRYHKTKDRFRSKIKIILKKLVKQFGYDTLIPYVPESESRLLTHMRKLDERQKRRKASLKAEGRPAEGTFDDMVESDEEDSDDGRTLMTGATGFTKLTGRSGATRKSTSGATKASRSTAAVSAASGVSKRTAAVRLPDETDGEVVDMLGSKIAKTMRFAQEANEEDDSEDDGAMEFDDDGRLIVPDDLDSTSKAVSEDGDTGVQRAGKKRRLSKFEDAKAQRTKQNGRQPRQLGAAFKSKRAGGDVKRKGQKYEPYAFVPLDGRSYSKKNRRHAVDQMSTVVRQGQGGKRKRK